MEKEGYELIGTIEIADEPKAPEGYSYLGTITLPKEVKGPKGYSYIGNINIPKDKYVDLSVAPSQKAIRETLAKDPAYFNKMAIMPIEMQNLGALSPEVGDMETLEAFGYKPDEAHKALADRKKELFTRGVIGNIKKTPKVTEEELNESSWARRIPDYGISALKGAISLPEAAVGLADIVTGGYAGKGAEAVGFKPKEAKEILDEYLSPQQKEANRKVQEAEGFFETIGTAIREPSTIVHSIIESAPSMVGGAGTARAGIALLSKIPKVVKVLEQGGKAAQTLYTGAGAMGEGAVSAGQTAEQIRQETPGGLLSVKQTALAAGSGFLTSLFGLMGGKLANRLEIGDIDILLAGGTKAETKKGIIRRAIESAISEGAFEELPQSAQEQIAQNVALGKPPGEGVANAAATGMLAGAVMGSGGGVFGRTSKITPAYDEKAVSDIQTGLTNKTITSDQAETMRDNLVVQGANQATIDQIDKVIFDYAKENDLPPGMKEGMQMEEAMGTQPEAEPEIDTAMDSIRQMLEAGEDVPQNILAEYKRRGGTVPHDIPFNEDRWMEATRKSLEAGEKIPDIILREYENRGGVLPEGYKLEKPASTLPSDETLETGEGKPSGDAVKVEQGGNEPIKIKDRAITPGGYVKPDETSESISKKLESLASDIDQKANEAATSPENDLSEPTEGQIDAGNYKKGHIQLHGLDISIENPKGSKRHGIDKHGEAWESELKSHYGYIRRTEGKDGDHVDVFIGENPESQTVYVVNQNDPETGKFDEHKVMMGYNTPNEARFGYLANYEKGWKGIKNIVPMTVDEFKAWLKEGDTTKELKKGVVPPIPQRPVATLPVQETLKEEEGKGIGEGEKEGEKAGQWQDIKELDAQVRTITPPKKGEKWWKVEIGTHESLGEMGGDILSWEYDAEPTIGEIKKDVDEYLRKYQKELEANEYRTGREDSQLESLDKLYGKIKAPTQSKPTEPEKKESPVGAEKKAAKAISEETEYPYYKYFTKYPKFLPLLNKLRKGQDLTIDPSFISFVQKFNEDMDVGNIPHRLSPSGNKEWLEYEVQTLIKDEMDRRKSGWAVAPVTITLSDEDLQDDGFIKEDKLDESEESIILNIQGIKEELYEEGYSNEEIAAIVRGIEAASADALNGKALEETIASLKEQVRQTEEQPSPTTDNQLFDTSGMFNLSGEQPVKPAGKFEPDKEKKAELFERPKPVFKSERDKQEEEKKKLEEALPSKEKGYGSDNKIFTKDEAEKAKQRLKEMLNELNVGINPELLMVGMKLAGYHIEAGARKFQDYSARMIDDVGEKIKPFLKSLYLAVRNYPGFDNKGMETERQIEQIEEAAKINWDAGQGETTQPIDIIENKEAGTEIHISKVAKGFSVAVKDVDSGEFLPTVKIYPTEEQARNVARIIATAGKKTEQPKTPGTIGKNKYGQDIYEDAKGVRSIVDHGVRTSEAVGLIPTRGGMVIDITHNDDRYIPVDKTQKEAIIEVGEQNEHRTDGSTSTGTLETDQPGNLSTDDRGQGAAPVQRSGGQTDTERDENINEGRDDGTGSMAGEPSPIHLQDSEGAGTSVSAGTSAVDDNSTPPSEPRSLQRSGVNPGNYRITEEDDIGSGTRGQKIDRNLAAIRLVKQLDKEHRYPTKGEQAILAKYVGWGGLKNVFDKSSSKPQDQNARKELESLLTKDEYMEAFVSMTNAHYTSPQVIQSIYKIMRHFGFTGGNILEPTYGAGNFLGLMPEDMASSSKWYGSELDIISAKIGQYLYPDSQLIQGGFQEAEFPYGKFDASVGNPPFGDERITDTRKDRSEINRMKIHNYIISKSGLHLKPGAVMGMVITNRFLDTADPEARNFLAKKFKFLGAVRLPNDAFAKNAGTEVTTDIVFFQRLMPDEKPNMKADWLTTGATMTNKDGETITLNKYFADNQALMLGEPSMKGTMYGGAWKEGGKGEFTLNKREGQPDTGQLIDNILENQWAQLKGVVQERSDDKLDAAALSLVPNKEDVGIGGYYLDGVKVFMRGDNDKDGNPTYTQLLPSTIWSTSLTPDDRGGFTHTVTKDGKKTTVYYKNTLAVPDRLKLGQTRLSRIRSMLRLRAKAYELVSAERFDLPTIEALRKELNKMYDAFVAEHGFLSEPVNFGLMADDVKIEFGLETDFRKEVTPARAKTLGVAASPASAKKASILKERLFYPEKEILYAKDAVDGYGISLSQKGKLDIDYIASLTNQPKEFVIQTLSKEGLIYQDPETNEWIQEDEYLSGNVKAKYKLVEGKEGFEKNAEALKDVFPKDVPTDAIFANPGAMWIPSKIYEEFGRFVGLFDVRVNMYKSTGRISMTAFSQSKNDVNVSWVNRYYGLEEIFNAVANNKVLIAWDGHGDDRIQNKEQTKALANTVKAMRTTFFDWVFADKNRAQELTKIYNETQNTHAKRAYNGKHLKPVGSNPAIILRNTQRDAAWRMIQSPKVLLDHCVGSGKTFTIITGIMERARMGLTNKAIVAVPNHLVGQWAADFMKLYPGARILAATKKDFEKSNRRRLFARIATGKFDAVIVGHSSFGFIPVERESITKLILEEIEHLQRAHDQAAAEDDKRLVKTLAKRIQKKREKIRELLNSPKDNVTNFEAMGIDHLVVDESHEFKNLEYSSAMQNITGMGNPMGSHRAFDLYTKIRWLHTQNNFALTFATGTPISNSLVEMYALLRYMNREGLVNREMEAFDAWANNYASVEGRIEYTSSQRLKSRTVMSTFSNMPELLQLYTEFADIVTPADMKRIYAEQIRESNERTGRKEREEFPIPKVKDGGRVLDAAEATPQQMEYVDFLVARAERLESLGRQNDPREDNHLWLMGDARKMALDIRLVDPTAGESPNNKVNRASRKIKEIYDRTTKDKGAQLVFCDLSTPAKTARKNADKFIRDALKKAKLDGDARIKATLNALATYHDKWKYIRDKIESEIDSISDHALAETEQYAKRREELEEYLETVTDDVVADLTTADVGFSVYDDMRAKLVDMGIPEGEIRFIHEANTDPQKQELFDLVNAGKIRVLIGSSQKMGAGMNAQERLVALHHLDAPWRPSDVEQREGRIIRQGNSLYETDPEGFKVEVIAYSTKNTFDAVMWQILARKGSMLDDFRSGQRSVEDSSTDSASYSDFMAETTGNPAFKEKFQLENEIEELETTKRKVQTRLRSAKQTIESNKERKTRLENAIEKRQAIIDKLSANSEFVFDGKGYRGDDMRTAIEQEKRDIADENDKATQEHTRATDAAINKALQDAGLEKPVVPTMPSGISGLAKYTQKVQEYNDFWESEKVTSIIAEAVKGIKKPPKKNWSSARAAKADKTGAISAALAIHDAINELEDEGTFRFDIGDVEIEVKKLEIKEESGKQGQLVSSYTFTVTADGTYVTEIKNHQSFYETDAFKLVDATYILDEAQSLVRNDKISLSWMEGANRDAQIDLEKLRFKDEEKLQAKKNRYKAVLEEVRKAEQTMADRRVGATNKYIDRDKVRFPNGYEPPHTDTPQAEPKERFTPSFTPAGTKGLRYENAPHLRITRSSDLGAFSFDTRPPSTPRFSVAQVEQFIAGALHRWGNIGNVKVIKTAGELPVRFMRYVTEGDKVMGAYDEDTDTVYLIADNIASARAAVITLVHEAVGHRGVDAILGPTERKVVMAQIAKAYENSPAMQKIARTYGLNMTRDDAARNIFKKEWIELSDNEQRRAEEIVEKDRMAASSELIAHMAESREQPSIFQRIIGMIRAALRRGFPELKWTDSDIIHLIQRARRFSGVVEKGKTGQYFKKAIDTSTENFRKWFGNSKVVDENGKPLVVYHGTNASDFDTFDTDNIGMVWVTPSTEYANIYADDVEDARVYPLYAKIEKPFDFGFRDSETQVPITEMTHRVINGINKAFEDGIVDKEKAQSLIKQIRGLEGIRRFKGFRRVYEWINEVPELTTVLKNSGYDGLMAREGEQGKHHAYAVFSPTQIKSIYNQGTWNPEDARISFKKDLSGNIPTPQASKEDIKQWLKDQTDAVGATVASYAPGNLPDMHFLERMFKNPLWYNHPVMKQLYNLMAHRRMEIYHNKFTDFNDAGNDDTVIGILDRLRRKDPKGYDQLKRILVMADAEWVRNKKWTFEDRINRMDVSDDVKKAAIQVRKSFDKMLDERQKSMREMIAELEGENIEEDPFTLEKGKKNFDHWAIRPANEFDSFYTLKGKDKQEKAGLPYHEGINYTMGHSKAGGVEVQAIHFNNEVFGEGEAEKWWNDNKKVFRKAHKDYRAELMQTLRGALSLMDEWRGYYFPRMRDRGAWTITAYREGDDGERQYIRETGGKHWSEIRQKELDRAGYKDISATETNKLPESIYLNIKTMDVQKAIDYSLQKMKGKASTDVLAKFNEDLIEQAANMIRERGIEATKIHRVPKGRVVKGYIEDPLEAYGRYLSGVSGGIAKGQVSQSATSILRQINASTESKVYDAAKRYIEENLRNADAADKYMAFFKSVATMKFLGFNPRSALVNMTAMVTTAPAAIHQYAGQGKINMGAVNLEITSAMKDYVKHMLGGKLEGADQAIVEKITKDGYDTPALTRDALGAMQGGLGRSWSRYMKAAMFMFSTTEQWNRGSTMFAAYRVAKKALIKQGMKEGKDLEAEAYGIAVEATEKAHAGYGKSNMPEWALGTSVSSRVGQAMYVYGNFGHNYVQMLYDLGAKKRNITAFVWALAAPMILAGGAAFPFKDEWLWLINGMLRMLGIKTGVDKFVWDQTRKHLGESAETFGRRGAFGLAGIDISGSLGIGLGLPTGLIGLAGAAGGVAEDIVKAGHYFSAGQVGRGTEKMLPTAAANILRARRESKTGVMSEATRPLWDKGGKIFRPTGLETAERVFGFQSARQSIARERDWEARRIEDMFKNKREAIYEELRAWAADPERDNKGLTKIYKKQADFDKEIIDMGLAGQIPLIRSVGIRNQIKSVIVPKKSEIIRLQNTR